MFPCGMLGSSRKLKRYGIELKGGGGGGGGSDGNNPGGNANDGAVVRFDLLAYQFDRLDLVLGGGGGAGSRQPWDILSSPLNNPGGGWRPGGAGGTFGSGGSSGSGGSGGGSTGVRLGPDLLGVAGGGPGGGGGSAGYPGSGGNGGDTYPAGLPTTGDGGAGEPAVGDGGGGAGGGGGVDETLRGGVGGRKGLDNSANAGGGRTGSSYVNSAKTLPFTGTPDSLSAYGLAGVGGREGVGRGDGSSGSNGIMKVTDYETGTVFLVNSSLILP